MGSDCTELMSLSPGVAECDQISVSSEQMSVTASGVGYLHATSVKTP